MNRLIAILMLVCWQSVGATYYVDFDGGNDASAGTSVATAWKTIPGTRNVTDTGFVTATYGAGVTVQKGDTIWLKGGTTANAAGGFGKVLISSSYYGIDAACTNPIAIRRDTAWGNGIATIDGAGVTMGGGGYGMFHITIPGVAVDGGTNYGIFVANAAEDGVSHYTATTVDGPIISSILFSNCGTSYAVTESAAAAVIQMKNVSTGYVSNVKILGNNLKLGGIAQSEYICTNVLVTNVWVQDLTGTEINKGGRGFVAQNSQVTWWNCTATNCAKGWDPGEDGSTDLLMVYKIINCTAINCPIRGIGLSSKGFEGAYTVFAQYYTINTVVYGCGEGMKVYAGPWTNVVAHCVFDGNGENLLIHKDGSTDFNTNYSFVFNTVLRKPTSSGNMDHGYWADGETQGHYYSDYNSYIQNSSESFSQFNTYGVMNHDFVYGANGPGHASGTWYAFNSWNNDANSKGTGATDTTQPPFSDVANHLYTITGAYAGTDLSGKTWYISEIGKDRNGAARSYWDIGSYERMGSAGAKESISGKVTFSGKVTL